MRRLHYHIVDVFTDRAFGGNPLAVCTNGRGVETETMQAIAKEFNLSETTFVLPPDDPRHDWRVRIFTPGSELPMAGHPTIGTTFVLAREHMIRCDAQETNIVLEEGVGPVPVRVEFRSGEPVFAEMSQPLPRFGPRMTDARAAAAMLSLDADDIDAELPLEVVSCGVPFLFVPLRSLDAAHRARPRADLMEQAAARDGVPPEVFVFTREVERAGSTVHSRMFAPLFGITEDPATGGASGPLGCYLVRHGVVTCENAAEIISEQGIEMGRPSFIRIRIEQDAGGITAVKVGGQCHFMGEGFIEI
ncbi:MAG: trans-2,3-dihydro-3-hydroxyanthranilate isomerase [Acidobacteriota bacterium]|jgi:trans-2,3-dihydro-3-hydroxyanthranilate isomerase|nr:trans-2,3-dihydro-3-hydroxyanthranilate isomerase [Acidobacteriota bacterium]